MPPPHQFNGFPLMRGDRTRRGVPGQPGRYADEAAIFDLHQPLEAHEWPLLFVPRRSTKESEIGCGAHLKVVFVSARAVLFLLRGRNISAQYRRGSSPSDNLLELRSESSPRNGVRDVHGC
jgi:hypothetical protein